MMAILTPQSTNNIHIHIITSHIISNGFQTIEMLTCNHTYQRAFVLHGMSSKITNVQHSIENMKQDLQSGQLHFMTISDHSTYCCRIYEMHSFSYIDCHNTSNRPCVNYALPIARRTKNKLKNANRKTTELFPFRIRFHYRLANTLDCHLSNFSCCCFVFSMFWFWSLYGSQWQWQNATHILLCTERWIMVFAIVFDFIFI